MPITPPIYLDTVAKSRVSALSQKWSRVWRGDHPVCVRIKSNYYTELKRSLDPLA